MAINLKKGQKIDLNLGNISVGLGWEPSAGYGQSFDLDASAFMLNEGRKIPTEGHFIFYGNTDSPDNALKHTGDDPTGGNSAGGDDEVILVNLTKVGEQIEEILFVVTIHDAKVRKQNFGQVRNSYIRIVDLDKNEEIAKYELDEDFSIETSVEFGKLYKRNGVWKFNASGIGYNEELDFFVTQYFDGDVIS